MDIHEERKTARLEARLTPAVYALVQHAARMQGRSVSEFVASAAQDAAEYAIERRDMVVLSRQDQERFADAMLNPPARREAFARAADTHRRLIQPT